MPLAPPSWGKAEAPKGLQDCIRALKQRRLGGRRSDHIALLVDDEIKGPETDGRSKGIFDAGATAGPRGHAENPRQRRSGFLGPDRLAFVDEGEVEAPEMDCSFGRPICVAVGHLGLEELYRERVRPLHGTNCWCFEPRSNK